MEERPRYACLSYCWGDTQDCILEGARLQEYETSIPRNTISQTVDHAIQITRAIGLPYLWVDRLCIVQDDDEDWLRESKTMSKVYGMSECTIVAAWGQSGQAGCFVKRNQYRARPCKIPNPFNHESDTSFLIRSHYLKDIYTREVKESAWYTRGWVFQERTLSPRLLIFGEGQMIWACESVQASEMWPCGKSSHAFIDRFESFEVDKRKLKSLCDASREIKPHETLWLDFILDYTHGKFSWSSDRLIALQGIASRIEAMTSRVYIAGLWYDDTLLYSLLWRAESDKLPKPEDQRAPSWSWAAINSPINIDLKPGRVQTMAKILTKHHTESDPQKTIFISLQISGSLLDAWLSKVNDTLKLSKRKLSKRKLDPHSGLDTNTVPAEPVLSKSERYGRYIKEKWRSRTWRVAIWTLAIILSPIWLGVGLAAFGIAVPFLAILWFILWLWPLLDEAMFATFGIGVRSEYFRRRAEAEAAALNPGAAYETYSMRDLRLGHVEDPPIHAKIHLDYQINLDEPLRLKLFPLAKLDWVVHGLVLQQVDDEETLTFHRIGVFHSEFYNFPVPSEPTDFSLC